MSENPIKFDELTYRDWLIARTDAVLDAAKNLISHYAASEIQKKFFLKTLTYLQLEDEKKVYQAPVHLPLLVFRGITGTDESAIPLAALTMLLWLGAELFDNLTDYDLSEEWKKHSPAEITMAASTVGSILPQVGMTHLEIPYERQQIMQQTLVKVLMRTFEGQGMDLRFSDAKEVSSKAVLMSVIGKNGEPKALFTTLAAQMAGVDEYIVKAYTDYGLALGVVYQLTSDFYEMFKHEKCQDLIQGTRTLQIALCLENLEGQERDDFLALLERGKTEETAQEEVRKILKKLIHLRPWLKIVRKYTDKANQALDLASPQEPAATILRNLLKARAVKCM